MGSFARRSSAQNRAHRKYWAEPRGGALTYVALGDSVGVGVGVDDPTHSYVGIITRRLAEATGQEIRTVNLAASGARARDLLEHQIPQLAALPAPHFTTCVIGGNDVAWARRFQADDFAQDVQAIASELPRGSVMGLVPHFVHWPYTGRARRVNQAIRTAAAAGAHTVADIHSATKALSLRGYMGTFAEDFFHPNDAGDALWADAVWAQLATR